MSAKMGQTLAGLLNASFGNAVEIIVGVAALLQGQIGFVHFQTYGLVLNVNLIHRRIAHRSNLCETPEDY